jgi:hypothetical protein
MLTRTRRKKGPDLASKPLGDIDFQGMVVLTYKPSHSKRAREERALAAERRIKALQSQSESNLI